MDASTAGGRAVATASRSVIRDSSEVVSRHRLVDLAAHLGQIEAGADGAWSRRPEASSESA